MDFCDGVILSKCFLNTRSLFQLGFDTMCHYLCYLTWQRSWIINVCYSSALQQTSHVNFINVTVHLCMLRLETFCDSLTFSYNSIPFLQFPPTEQCLNEPANDIWDEIGGKYVRMEVRLFWYPVLAGPLCRCLLIPWTHLAYYTGLSLSSTPP